MSRRTRTVFWVLGFLVVLVIGVLAVAIGPRLGATRTLISFGWPVPDDLEKLEDFGWPGSDELEKLAKIEKLEVPEKPAPGFEHLTDASRFGVENLFLRRIQDGKRYPTIVFVHGVAKIGLRDGRVLRAIEAFHRGGFTVVAPELKPPLDPTRSAGELERLDRLLAAISAGDVPGADGARIGLVGISVGGAVALRAAARFQASGGAGLRGVLAIGAPDNLRPTAEGWFDLPDPDPAGGESLEWKRRSAAAFARNFVVRAAMSKRLAGTADFNALRDWLAEDPLPKGEPPALTTEAARDLVKILRGSPEARQAARGALLDDAWEALAPLSPADWTSELADLSGVAVFLLHGKGDPLIPVGDADLLEKRLAAYTVVSTLKSALLGHTTIGEAGLLDRFKHIVFMDDFFDMLGG